MCVHRSSSRVGFALSKGVAPPERAWGLPPRCYLRAHPSLAPPPAGMAISFLILLSRQGKVRLAKWYETLPPKEKSKICAWGVLSVRQLTSRWMYPSMFAMFATQLIPPPFPHCRPGGVHPRPRPATKAGACGGGRGATHPPPIPPTHTPPSNPRSATLWSGRTARSFTSGTPACFSSRACPRMTTSC